MNREVEIGMYTMCVCSVASIVSNSLQPMDCSPPGFSVCGVFPGKNAGVGGHALLQGIFPTQGLNSHLLGVLLVN